MRRPSLHALLRPIIAFMAALGLSTVIIVILTDRPEDALGWLFFGAFRSPLAFGTLLESAARLTISGIAASLAFRSGMFNLGGEGQALAGGLAGAATAMAMPNFTGVLALPTALAAGVAAGALIGAISGALKARWNVDELISSFLISSAALPIGQVLLSGPMKDADSYLIAAPPLPEAFRLPMWLPPSRLGPVVIWAALVSIAGAAFLYYTRLGYEWRLRGANALFARYGGIRTGRIAVLSMAVSGALFGLAGSAALFDGGQAVQGFTSGLGWNGLAVALIAGTRPEFVPLASLAYAWLETGTEASMMHSGFPFALIGLVQATVFLLVTGKKIWRRRSDD